MLSEPRLPGLAGSPAGRRVDEALREREALDRGIFEATSDGLVINDLDGRIVEVNPAMCRMHGYSREEFLQLYPTAFIHPDYHQAFAAYLQTVRAGGQFRTRAVDVRRDGSPLHVAIHGVAITYQGRRHVLGIVRDISEQVQAQALLQQRVEERTAEVERRRHVAEGVRDILAVLNSNRTLDQILQYIVAQTPGLMGAAACAIFQMQAESGALRIRAADGLNAEYVARVDVPFGQGTVGVAAEQRRPVALSDFPAAAADPTILRLPPEQRALVREYLADRFLAVLTVPLIVKDETYGALSLYYVARHDFSEEDIRLAVALSDQIALAIENARLFAEAQGKAALEERQRLARDLHDSVSQTLFSAGLIAEVLPQLTARRPEEGQRRLEELRQLTRGALAEMRMLLLELRPAALVEAPLPDLLRQLADATTGRARLPIRVTVEGRPLRLPPDTQVALYRLAQEALHNVTKHAEAGTAAIQLIYAANEVHLEVADDGRGFDPAAAPADRHGLRIMRERAAAVGAQLDLTSCPGHGTRLTVTWREATPG